MNPQHTPAVSTGFSADNWILHSYLVVVRLNLVIYRVNCEAFRTSYVSGVGSSVGSFFLARTPGLDVRSCSICNWISRLFRVCSVIVALLARMRHGCHFFCVNYVVTNESTVVRLVGIELLTSWVAFPFSHTMLEKLL